MLVFDLHQDLAWKRLSFKEKFFKETPLWENEDSNIPNQVDFPRLKKGKVKLVFASSFSEKGDFKEVESHLKFYFWLEKTRKFSIIRFKKDLKKLMKTKKIGLLLHIEGLDFIKKEKDLKMIENLFKIGIRSIGLTHNHQNQLAGGALSEGGLTNLGKKLIEKAQKLNFIIDLAHLNRKSFAEVLKILKLPPLFSHGNVSKLFPHPRNLEDWQIKEIIKKEGLIGISFVPRFLKKATLKEVSKNFRYVIKLKGENNLALGSDFDGMVGKELVKGLEDASQFEHLKKFLEKEKFKKEIIEKIFYQNALNFLEKMLP